MSARRGHSRRTRSGLHPAAACLLLCLALAGFAPASIPEATDPPAAAGSFRAQDGTSLPLRSWLPQGRALAAIVALHGFGDYSAAFRDPARYWAAQGIATFAFDQRGFGGAPHTHLWAGKAAMAADALTLLADIRRRYPGTPVYLLGESMGGAVAIVATTGGDAPPGSAPDGVILVSPAVWEHDFVGSVERSALWLMAQTAPSLWLEPPRGLDIRPSDNIEMLRAMGRDSLVQLGARVDATAGLMDLMDAAGAAAPSLHLPTLALFGRHEEVLPPEAVSRFLARLPSRDITVAIYPEGYHMLLRDLHGAIVWRDVAAWIADRTAPLPSGDGCAGQAAAAPPCAARAPQATAAGVPSAASLR